jgi:hypothetical protein
MNARRQCRHSILLSIAANALQLSPPEWDGRREDLREVGPKASKVRGRTPQRLSIMTDNTTDIHVIQARFSLSAHQPEPAAAQVDHLPSVTTSSKTDRYTAPRWRSG